MCGAFVRGVVSEFISIIAYQSDASCEARTLGGAARARSARRDLRGEQESHDKEAPSSEGMTAGPKAIERRSQCAPADHECGVPSVTVHFLVFQHYLIRENDGLLGNHKCARFVAKANTVPQ